jgi:hypothetical protein
MNNQADIFDMDGVLVSNRRQPRNLPGIPRRHAPLIGEKQKIE